MESFGEKWRWRALLSHRIVSSGTCVHSRLVSVHQMHLSDFSGQLLLVSNALLFSSVIKSNWAWNFWTAANSELFWPLNAETIKLCYEICIANYHHHHRHRHRHERKLYLFQSETDPCCMGHAHKTETILCNNFAFQCTLIAVNLANRIAIGHTHKH